MFNYKNAFQINLLEYYLEIKFFLTIKIQLQFKINF